MANTAVKGRVVFAGSGEGIMGVTVSASDIDPLTADDHLGTVKTDVNGDFLITYAASRYRLWFLDRNPDIEVRIHGEGGRLLWETAKRDDVTDDVFDVGTIRIHESNFRTLGKDDPSWLVTHTSLDPANGVPIRLTSGNEIEWLVDGDVMFLAITNEIAGATRSIKLMNTAFAVEKLFSTFEFPPGKDHKTVLDTDTVKVRRLETIMQNKADFENVPVNVFVWDLESSGGVFGFDIFGDADLADEVRAFFEDTDVVTDVLEGSQLLHIKMLVVDGKTAFVIGSTMKQGYFNDQEHTIYEARHGGGELMHDVSLRVRGPAVRFVDQTFSTLWAAGRTVTSVPPDPQVPETDTEVSVQVLRTLPGELFTSDTPDVDTEDLPHGETGILEAYQRAIMKAEEFIYIEDQYFTSPEIATAIKLRMAEKPDLEVILVLNVKPDIPGYQKKQTALIKELRDSLGAQSTRLGVFTMWSGDVAHPLFEIAHIYVHAKVAIIDDKWATVGTANLDGASLNWRQWGMILQGKFDGLSTAQKILVRLFSPLVAALAGLASIPIVLVAKAAGTSPSLAAFIVDSIQKEVVRASEHASPHRDRQPARHPEINLVLYNDVAGQKPTEKIRELRESLWTEQLGAAPPTTRPTGGWVGFWEQAAADHLTKVRAASGNPPKGATQTKILKWVSRKDPERTLKFLKVETDFIEVRGSGAQMDFEFQEQFP